MESHEKCANCAAIIPCLNEAGTIAEIVRGTWAHVGRVWVIDDGSLDSTSDEARKAGAVLIQHERNLGKGASLRQGLAAAHKAGFKIALMLDGDGQHDPTDIPKLIEAVERGADLAIGNRFASKVKMPMVRRFVNRWMNARLAQRLGIECPDSQSGFRAVRLEALASLSFTQNRFEVESEMLTTFARAGRSIAFVPVKCLPARRASRIHPIVDTVRWFRWWFATK